MQDILVSAAGWAGFFVQAFAGIIALALASRFAVVCASAGPAPLERLLDDDLACDDDHLFAEGKARRVSRAATERAIFARAGRDATPPRRILTIAEHWAEAEAARQGVNRRGIRTPFSG